MSLSEQRIETILTTWPVARLATCNDAGQPKQVPIVFTYQHGVIWSPVDGKPKRNSTLARVKNVMAHPQASLLLDEYSDDWQQLWWIHLDITVEAIALNDRGLASELSDAAGEAVVALKDKYPQYQQVTVLQEPPTLLRMSINKINSWRFK